MNLSKVFPSKISTKKFSRYWRRRSRSIANSLDNNMIGTKKFINSIQKVFQLSTFKNVGTSFPFFKEIWTNKSHTLRKFQISSKRRLKTIWWCQKVTRRTVKKTCLCLKWINNMALVPNKKLWTNFLNLKINAVAFSEKSIKSCQTKIRKVPWSNKQIKPVRH
jgi:hypothetical protein